jgi:8-amino-7-oxononanoate synthase
MSHTMQSAPGARTLIDDRWRDYFSGTGYLGLQGHPDLIAAAAAALQRYGLTTATSRGGFGEHPVFSAVEAAAARFFDAERALYTVSAYLGSGLLLQGLHGLYDRLFVDEQSHFSVREAVAACGVPAHLFPHCDPAALAESLRTHVRPGESPFVLTDGVFPISGEIAPAAAYVQVLAEYEGARLCLDDAHAVGVLGDHGRGLAEYWGLEAGPVPVHTTGTLSKALGGHGGVVAGEVSFIEQLWSSAAALAGSSPSPIPAAAASAWALDHVASHPELLTQLRTNVRRVREGFRSLGWPVEGSPVPIICLRALPGIDLAHLHAALFARDICVAHVTRYSSTPSGGALRVAIFATHTDEQIDRLLDEVRRLM